MIRLRMPVDAVYASGGLHNGSVSCDSVPLRKEGRKGTRPRTSVDAVCAYDGIHNGSKSCDSVPLRFR